MFNFKAVLLLLVAGLFGLGAAVFANQWLQEQAGRKSVASEVETIPVLVATRDLGFGQRIEEIDFKTVQWPTELAPAGVISDPEIVIGRVTNQKMLAGEPLLEARVVEQLSGSTLSSLVAPNMRAITVRVNDVAGVAGFLLPGNHVDVLGTRRSNGRAQTATVLQNVKVLAVDQTARTDKDEPVVVRAVTLEADLEDSIKLVRATEEGSVQLVLRNPEDLSTRIEAVAVKPRQRVAAPSIRIIRGTSVGSVAVSN